MQRSRDLVWDGCLNVRDLGGHRTDANLLRGRTRRNTTVNFHGRAEAGALVDVKVEAATSTTLRGTEQAAVAA